SAFCLTAPLQHPRPGKPAKQKKASGAEAKAIWFYTSEGERLGPVSFDELRTMASESSLDPRLDLVWKKEMAEWKPAGQIDGLFQRTSVPAQTKESKTLPADSFQAPKKKAKVVVARGESWPGARRRSLLLVTLVFPFIWHYLLTAASPLLTRQFGPLLIGKILPLATFLPLVVVVWFVMKRLVNLGMSRLWCLAIFAPFLNLWVGYRCLVCPPGYAYQKKLDGPGVALAALYWLAVIPCILLFLAVMALLSDSISSPSLQEHARDALRIAGRIVTLTRS
ncbi:MAG: DUF4339 domain-containing protein, partial [Verrucomicrobiaceae bacterium]